MKKKRDINMNKTVRPTIVSVMGWLIIVFSIIGLLGSLVTVFSPDLQKMMLEMDRSLTRDLIFSVIYTVIAFISGLAILKGHSWGRLLYLIMFPSSLLIIVILDGFQPLLITSVIMYIVMFVLLTRPAFNAYFKQEYSDPTVTDSEKQPESQRFSTNNETGTAKIVYNTDAKKQSVSTVRKVFAIILLSFGGMLLSSFSIALYMILKKEPNLKLGIFLMTFGILFAIVLILVLVSVLLWGWKRWRMVLGIFLASVGVLLGLVAIAFPLSMMSPQWEIAMRDNPINPAEMKKIMTILTHSGILFGLSYSIPGFLLIFFQIRADKKALAK